MQDLSELGYPGYFIDRDMQIYVQTRAGDIRPVKYNTSSNGSVKVNMVRSDGKRTTIPVGTIVATLYVENHNPQFDDTVTYRDGDKQNYHPANLMWRPRWFAVEYHKQFERYSVDDEENPVYERETKLIFKNIMHACIYHGILYRQVLESIESTTPTYTSILFTTYPTGTTWAFYY